MLVFFLMFTANLLIAGTLIRLIQVKWPDSPVAKALMFAY